MPAMATPTDPELLEAAVTIIRKAGDFTLQHFRRDDLAIDRKGDGTPVTVADRGAERLVREELERLFPDDGILGEEEAEKIGTSGRRFVRHVAASRTGEPSFNTSGLGSVYAGTARSS